VVRGTSPPEAKVIVGKVVEAAAAREAAAKGARADAAQGARSITPSLPGKLADCQGKRPGKSETVSSSRGDSGGRQRQAGPQPRVPGRAAAARYKILNVEAAARASTRC